MGVIKFVFLALGLSRIAAHSYGGGHHYHWKRHGGFYFGGFSGIAGVGIIVLSSTVVAGIRRATGLTFKRTLHKRSSFNIRAAQRWLEWYNSRIGHIVQSSEVRVTRAIQRHGPDIADPQARLDWERKLRADIEERFQSLRDRHNYYLDIVQGRQEPKQDFDNPPLLDFYLSIGEWCYDYIVRWMRRSSMYWVESLHFDGSPNAADIMLLDSYADGDDGEEVPGNRIREVEYEGLQEPSAPDMTESMIMKPSSSSAEPPPYTPTTE